MECKKCGKEMNKEWVRLENVITAEAMPKEDYLAIYFCVNDNCEKKGFVMVDVDYKDKEKNEDRKENPIV